ncbi:ShlB/FhaC/HecB family hemolysin secretion/activation protein [Luteibacter aegosomatissinici]|uniref:ShlB/FhaC/HecB family hemolysin secretion/activation protein n=1 Tax=Luteibacter aegosomatissinici TaxID=2911539 RepID=UPI001FF9BE08|nr:ShlB/FhaC/HecB family hemolysin secretion/activation protein [Luteibacter aegosomatissinici]UPG94223.1 ShlB/FhaC/HecB family hemolysin secretion/activation protein [Luteibacter aegosomatissinici]
MSKIFKRRPSGAFAAIGVAGFLVVVTGLAHAQQAQTLDQQEQRDRAQREAQARQDQQQQPDVRLDATRATDFHRVDVPNEAGCFRVSRVALEGRRLEAFAFAQRYLDRYVGKCVGHDGVNTIVRRVSDLVIDRGYVTTRIGLAPQDLSTGTLRLTLVPGTIHAVRFANDSFVGTWQTALPARPGDLLNLRDIEQGLEQFKRVPSQDVTIDIAPGEQPGESDLVISMKRSRPWHVVVSLDDSGSRATGRLQGGLNVGLDNPLRINDVLSLGYNHDVYHSDGHSTRGNTANYAAPIGNWLVTASVYDYKYHQTVEGSQQTFRSSGKSRTTDITVQRMVHRTKYGKTSVELRIGKRWAHSFIEDSELLTQKRDVTTAELALVQRQYLGNAQLDLRVAHRRGVTWFGGQHDPWGQSKGSPTFQYGLNLIDTSLNVPFQVGRMPMQWTTELRAQRSSDTLYASEFITIGGRYSVRGFDGEETLAGERGWYWRNTFSVPLGHWPVVAYTGIDGGHVGGPSIRALPEKSLRGEFIGLRGSLGPISFDAFAGWADKGGRALNTMRPATGFQLVYQY